MNLAALQNTAAWLISRKTFKLKNLVLHRKTNHADVPPRIRKANAQECRETRTPLVRVSCTALMSCCALDGQLPFPPARKFTARRDIELRLFK